MMSDTYNRFLAGKKFDDIESGFDVALDDLNEKLFDFQKVIVRWALRRGRAAIFADTGLGKTAMQVVWADNICRHTGGKVLILAPLAVAKQTVLEARKFGISVQYARDQSQVGQGITTTNYEMIDHFDSREFVGVVLDEASILKSIDGKTRTRLIDSWRNTPYRLPCTATPSPNDYMELGNQAEFLGIMSQSEMLATFFTHDSGDTSKWRLKGHGQRKFWEWMATWAVVIRKPSDIGDFDDSQYDLPPLRYHHHILDAKPIEGELFPRLAMTLSEQRMSQRESINDRVGECVKLVNESTGPWLIWCNLNIESAMLAKSAIDDCVEVVGGDSIEKKESAIHGFISGENDRLISKSSIFGYGLNLQRCRQMVFVGVTHSFESFYQTVRRCWRFGQTEPVDVHIIATQADMAILDNIKRKEHQHNELSTQMVQHMKKLQQQEVVGAKIEKTNYQTDSAGEESWTLHLGDCVDVASDIKSNTIHYTIFSPPFSSLYVYSASDRDMGNSKDDGQFYEHFRFLVNELHRITMPGRLLSFHCMNLPTSKAHDGYIGIRDFRGEMIRMFKDEGWIYHSEVCIWKDPVVSMQRTKALGLLHKQLVKDSAMSRMGIPDYIVTMRKPGDNPEPISGELDSWAGDDSFKSTGRYSIDVWQRYASPIWTDINQSRTLNNYRSARENDDERHIAPLQLDVIERCIQLWSNPGDLVFSPFAGIGSEGYMALQMRRKFLGVELKRSYWQIACQNLIEAKHKQGDLLEALG